MERGRHASTILGSRRWRPKSLNTRRSRRLYPLEPRIVEVKQTQTSNIPKLRINPNFEQTQTSNEPKLRTNSKVSGFRGTNPVLGGLRIIPPPHTLSILVTAAAVAKSFYNIELYIYTKGRRGLVILDLALRLNSLRCPLSAC